MSGRHAGPRIRGIADVAAKHLCLGCGTCASVQPEAVRMVDDLRQGRRPLVLHVEGRPVSTDAALAACPGVRLEHDRRRPSRGEIPELFDAWGPVLEVWEGWASDPEIRFRGSSGGAATALALHAVEAGGMHGVLHIRAREDVPYLNETVLSTSRAQLVAATGSRYAPASPCDRLDLVENAPAPSVLIGKPCDVEGAAKARAMRPALDQKLGATIAMFCAGTPSTDATLQMARQLGVTDPASIREVRYRGNGWPGMAEVAVHGEADGQRQMTYAQSWGDILQRHRQWRCYVCPDHTGEFADIAVGDPWYTPPVPGDPGRSLVLVRTERGRQLVRAALDAGALELDRVEAHLLPDSQPHLLKTRGAIWGRMAVTRLLGVATPRYRRMPTFRHWWRELTVKEKGQSLAGTARRVRRKRLYEAAPPDDGRT